MGAAGAQSAEAGGKGTGRPKTPTKRNSIASVFGRLAAPPASTADCAATGPLTPSATGAAAGEAHTTCRATAANDRGAGVKYSSCPSDAPDNPRAPASEPRRPAPSPTARSGPAVPQPRRSPAAVGAAGPRRTTVDPREGAEPEATPPQRLDWARRLELVAVLVSALVATRRNPGSDTTGQLTGRVRRAPAGCGRRCSALPVMTSGRALRYPASAGRSVTLRLGLGHSGQVLAVSSSPRSGQDAASPALGQPSRTELLLSRVRHSATWLPSMRCRTK